MKLLPVLQHEQAATEITDKGGEVMQGGRGGAEERGGGEETP